MTDDLIEHFEAYLEDEKGYQDIIVKSEVLATTPDYFTLKLFCFQGAGSSYPWNYYYTIDDETSFYLNENGNVVICFDEGDVAPMYMGAVEFEIPAEVLSNIRK